MYSKNISETVRFAEPSKVQFDFCLAYYDHFSSARDIHYANMVMDAYFSRSEVDARSLRAVDAMMPRFVGKFEILPF